MTAQMTEVIIHEGRPVALCSQPLSDYFALGGVCPDFEATSTALWRGYVGTWDITAGRLYLISLRGTLKGGGDVNLDTLFPGFPDRVFAHWYSGTLRIPQGKLLQYVHSAYASTYENDLFIDIDKGVIKATRIRHNGTAKEDDTSTDDRIAAMTVIRRTPSADRKAK